MCVCVRGGAGMSLISQGDPSRYKTLRRGSQPWEQAWIFNVKDLDEPYTSQSCLAFSKRTDDPIHLICVKMSLTLKDLSVFLWHYLQSFISRHVFYLCIFPFVSNHAKGLAPGSLAFKRLLWAARPSCLQPYVCAFTPFTPRTISPQVDPTCSPFLQRYS